MSNILIWTFINIAKEEPMGTISWLGGQNVEHFGGADSWRRIAGRQSFPANGPFTVSVTFCASPQQSGNAVILSADGSTPFYLGRLWNGNVRAGDAWNDTGVPFPSDGLWHRLTLVRQDGATILYLDGDEKARLGHGIPNPSGLDFRIGRQYGEHGEYFRGAVAEVVVFSEAHSAAQVRGYDGGGLVGAKPGVCTLVRFDLDRGAEQVSGQPCSGLGDLRSAPAQPPLGIGSWLGGQNVEHFGGADSWRRIAGRQSFPANGPFTVSVTFCASPQQSGNAVILSADGSTPFYLGRLWNGNVRAGDAWNDTGVPFPSDGLWHRLTLVRQDGATILYLDGDEKARLGHGIPNPSGLDFRIGRQYGEHGEYFRGAVAEVVVFSEAHSAAQVRGYDGGGLVGAKPGVCTLVRFDLDRGAEQVSGQPCSGLGDLRSAPAQPPLVSSGPSLSTATTVNPLVSSFPRFSLPVPIVPPLNMEKVEAVANGASAIIAGSALLLQTISAALAAINVDRKVSIGLNNHLKQDLIEPEYFCLMGKFTELPLVIAAGEADRIVAAQSEGEASGAVGIVAYKVKNTGLRLVILYSVPFDQVSYENWFKLSLISDTVAINKALYDDMYYNQGVLTPGTVVAGKDGHARWMVASDHPDLPYFLDGVMGNGGTTVLDVAAWRLEPPVMSTLPVVVRAVPVPAVAQAVIAAIGLVFALIDQIFRWMKTERKIGIAIDNQSGHDLHKPKYHTSSGKITAIGLNIRHKNAALISAEKSQATPYGTYGVVSYVIGNTARRLVVMWSIPGTYAGWKNWFKATVVDENVPMDEKLFDDMYNDKVAAHGKTAPADGGTATWQSGGYILQGIMTNGGAASLRLSITDPELPRS